MLPNWLYGKSKSKLASILGGGGGGTITPHTATLTAGSTEVTITSSEVHTDSFVLPIASVWGIMPSTVQVSENQVTMTFSAQQSDITVGIIVF